MSISSINSIPYFLSQMDEPSALEIQNYIFDGHKTVHRPILNEIADENYDPRPIPPETFNDSKPPLVCVNSLTLPKIDDYSEKSYVIQTVFIRLENEVATNATFYLKKKWIECNTNAIVGGRSYKNHGDKIATVRLAPGASFPIDIRMPKAGYSTFVVEVSYFDRLGESRIDIFDYAFDDKMAGPSSGTSSTSEILEALSPVSSHFPNKAPDLVHNQQKFTGIPV